MLPGLLYARSREAQLPTILILIVAAVAVLVALIAYAAGLLSANRPGRLVLLGGLAILPLSVTGAGLAVGVRESSVEGGGRRGAARVRRRRLRGSAYACPLAEAHPQSVSSSPLIEPDVRISRIRLSDRFHAGHSA